VRHDAATGLRAGRIVEVEAYIGTNDRASHARFGRTPRSAVMFGPPGIAYVYLVYGMHDCLNVVTEPAGRPAALLVRAVEPEEGIDAMRRARIEREIGRRRDRSADATRRVEARLAEERIERLASGPGLVAAAFGLDRTHTGLDLLDSRSAFRIEVAEDDCLGTEIRVGARVGVGYAGEPWASQPWRFAIAGSMAVSAPAL